MAVIVVDYGQQVWKATVVKEAALLVTEESFQRGGPVHFCGRSVCLESVDTHFLRRVHVKARFGKERGYMTTRTLRLAIKQLLAPASGDDLSGNTGPSLCDPTEDGPRGVFRAIRRVYASFYNDNAFLERLRFNINESQVGMGLLVHYSAPDEIEMANGVATVKMAVGSEGNGANLVSQAGAVSITNPDGNSRPELVWAHDYPFLGLHLGLTQSSSLRLLGEHVMTWRTESGNMRAIARA